MIPEGVEIFVALEPIDLRFSFDRLSGLVEDRIGRSARSGALFVFFGKRRTAMKILFFDRNGMCQFYKRLDKSTFRLPVLNAQGATSLQIEERALTDLLRGIDLESTSAKRSNPRRLH